MKKYRIYAANGDYLGRFTFSRDDIERLEAFRGATLKGASVYLV
jgi:hypothetical protein